MRALVEFFRYNGVSDYWAIPAAIGTICVIMVLTIALLFWISRFFKPKIRTTDMDELKRLVTLSAYPQATALWQSMKMPALSGPEFRLFNAYLVSWRRQQRVSLAKEEVRQAALARLKQNLEDSPLTGQPAIEAN